MFAHPITSLRLVFFFALCLIALTVTSHSGASKQPQKVKPASAPTLGSYASISVALSTDTTVGPDAAPTGTTSLSVFSSTNFKGKLEGNPTTGNIRVTDANPAGSYPVTVIAFSGSGGPTTTQSFTLTVTTPATCDPVSFTATTFEAGERVGGNLVGDFNGDGKQDLAVGAVATDFSSSRSIILLGDGAGNFTYVSDVPISARAVVDFNGDGKQDLIALDSGNAVLYMGDGTGHFTVFNSVDTGCTSPFQLAVGDFNGDGKIDLVTACYFVDGVTILLGDGAGGFGTPASFGVSDGPQGLAVGDFNNDGKQDLAVACMPAGVVSILLGDGAGGFSAPTDFNAGATPRDVEVGDFNGDGKQDLAVSNPSTNTASVMLGNGLGSFGTPASFAVGTDPETIIAVGDFNGDGKQDLAVPNFGSANVSLLLGDGAGGFGSATNLAVGLSPFGVVVGDFNGDGMEDLATGNWDSNNTSILLRHCTTASLATPAGDNVGVQAGTATVHFANVSASGTTTFEPIDASSAGSLPSGFTLCPNCPAYDITTTATYTAPLAICLAVPPNITQPVYVTLKLMHGEGGTLVDRTTGHFVDSGGQRWICGSVNSLSPFVLAQGQSPTAAAAQVVGRIVDTQGNPIAGVGISMNGDESRSTITDNEGVYRFDQVPASGFYTVTPSRANYSFAPVNRSFSSLGFRTEASFTATFHDGQTNAIDTSEFFVRQQYLDFLNREPDPAGLDYWTSRLTSCNTDQPCLRGRRTDVSNAFFFELEHQQTAAFIFRLYRAAYGNMQPFPNPDATNSQVPVPQQAEARKLLSYAVFLQERARLIGGPNLEQDQLALANSFVQRAEFLNKYPASLTLDQFVDTLLLGINNDDGVDLLSQRTALIKLGSRGAVMYRLSNDNGQASNGAINNHAFIDAEYNRSFVASQYFGYLHRDADIGGFLFWLGQVNMAPLRDVRQQHALVCSQITSAEYQQRFGALVTHANVECGP